MQKKVHSSIKRSRICLLVLMLISLFSVSAFAGSWGPLDNFSSNLDTSTPASNTFGTIPKKVKIIPLDNGRWMSNDVLNSKIYGAGNQAYTFADTKVVYDSVRVGNETYRLEINFKKFRAQASDAFFNFYRDGGKDWIELSTDGYYPNKTRSEVEFEIKSDKGISNAYLGIIDLDGNNSGTNEYVTSNSRDSFLDKTTTSGLKYDSTSNTFIGTEGSEDSQNVFTKFNGKGTLTYGIRVSRYGFAFNPSLAVAYYTVDYKSINGEITSDKNEDVFDNQNPVTNVVNKPNKNYKFEKFTCNKDVTLTDGTRIVAGDKITEEQIKKIVVTDDITITATNVKNVGSLKIVKKN